MRYNKKQLVAAGHGISGMAAGKEEPTAFFRAYKQEKKVTD